MHKTDSEKEWWMVYGRFSNVCTVTDLDIDKSFVVLSIP